MEGGRGVSYSLVTETCHSFIFHVFFDSKLTKQQEDPPEPVLTIEVASEVV